jgi:hypothetical protein
MTHAQRWSGHTLPFICIVYSKRFLICAFNVVPGSSLYMSSYVYEYVNSSIYVCVHIVFVRTINKHGEQRREPSALWSASHVAGMWQWGVRDLLKRLKAASSSMCEADRRAVLHSSLASFVPPLSGRRYKFSRINQQVLRLMRFCKPSWDIWLGNGN